MSTADCVGLFLLGVSLLAADLVKPRVTRWLRERHDRADCPECRANDALLTAVRHRHPSAPERAA